jgi:HK97 family phage portal protein
MSSKPKKQNLPNLLRFRRTPEVEEERSDLALSFQDWVNMFQFGGVPYTVMGGNQPNGDGERIESNFAGYVNGAYKGNSVVFACMAARQLLFSEARFQYRRLRFGRPGDLFGTAALGILENPWPGGSTGELLSRASLDVDLAGNFFAVRRGQEIRRLRPDWVTIVTGSRTGSEIDAEVIGYMYKPGGPASGEDPVVLLPEQVAHFAPYPDPIASYRGVSWVTSIVEEISADNSATSHKRNFFDQGAQLGYVVTMDADMNPDRFDQWVSKFRAGHEGAQNAFKTLFLAGGADVKTVGANMQQADLTNAQGAGETRICNAARVPAIIVGVTEGLESATYSNYAQARRAFADLTMRPMWRGIAHSLANIVDVPPDAELWYDDRDIPFLQEDVKDEAEIQQTQANTIRTLVDAGFTWESAVAAVTNGDMTMLDHTGLFSVQLQEPGAEAPSDQPSVNGNGQPQLPAPTP